MTLAGWIVVVCGSIFIGFQIRDVLHRRAEVRQARQSRQSRQIKPTKQRYTDGLEEGW